MRPVMFKVVVNPARSVVCRWCKARSASAVYDRDKVEGDDMGFTSKKVPCSAEGKMAQSLHQAAGDVTPSYSLGPTVAHM